MAEYTLALTGNIGCGKSTAAAAFARFGARVVDADRLGHHCFSPEHPAYHFLLRSFPTAFRSDGTVDRKALGGIVFGDAGKKSLLERIVWPFVFEEVDAASRQAPDVFVWEAAQIVEAMRAGYPVRRHYDALVVVAASHDVQRERLRSRGLDDMAIATRIAAQLPQDEKIRCADYVIRNDGSLPCLEASVRALLDDIRQPF